MLKVTHRDLIDRALAEVEHWTLKQPKLCWKTMMRCSWTCVTRESWNARAKCPTPFTHHAACWSFGSIHHRLITKKYSPRARSWSSTAKAAGVRRWPPRPCKTWDWNASATSATATAAGRTAAQPRKTWNPSADRPSLNHSTQLRHRSCGPPPDSDNTWYC